MAWGIFRFLGFFELGDNFFSLLHTILKINPENWSVCTPSQRKVVFEGFSVAINWTRRFHKRERADGQTDWQRVIQVLPISTFLRLPWDQKMTCHISIEKHFSQQLKNGSWNSMISAHINRQIFANIGICPYCFLIVNPFQPKSCIKKWANNPRYRDPSLRKCHEIFCRTGEFKDGSQYWDLCAHIFTWL